MAQLGGMCQATDVDLSEIPPLSTRTAVSRLISLTGPSNHVLFTNTSQGSVPFFNEHRSGSGKVDLPFLFQMGSRMSRFLEVRKKPFKNSRHAQAQGAPRPLSIRNLIPEPTRHLQLLDVGGPQLLAEARALGRTTGGPKSQKKRVSTRTT